MERHSTSFACTPSILKTVLTNQWLVSKSVILLNTISQKNSVIAVTTLIFKKRTVIMRIKLPSLFSSRKHDVEVMMRQDMIRINPQRLGELYDRLFRLSSFRKTDSKIQVRV